MDDQQQDTEVFESPRDPASGVDDGAGGSMGSAEAAWDAGTKDASDWAPIGAEGPAHLPDADAGGSTDPWAAPAGGETGGIIEAMDREAANRLPIDDTPPTGIASDNTPDGEIPPDAETFVSR